MLNKQEKWEKIQEILEELARTEYRLEMPFTYYYRKAEKIIGSYFCGDEKEDFILFVNKDYPNPSLIIDLIDQHCHILNQEVLVYTLDDRGITLYESVTPENYMIIDL